MSEPDVLVDTSVALPLVLQQHDQHERVRKQLGGRRLGLAGHAAFEAFSVLTRLPLPSRRSPEVAARILSANFPETRYLSSRGAAALARGLGGGDIAGGAVYDALVAAAAHEHGVVLATRDERAAQVYRWLGAAIELVGSD